MIELPLVFVGGLLGSGHCLGMCGPFALLLGSHSRSARANWARQLAYTLGRLFTYTFLGAIAGFGTWRVVRALPVATRVPAWLAIAAGLFLAYQGLRAAGVWRRQPVSGAEPCLLSPSLRQTLAAPGWLPALVAGLFTGLLPCGLTYAFLAMAASAAQPLRGGLIMFTFGLGTGPLMLLAGIGGRWLHTTTRWHLYRLAAWSVVAAGVVCCCRGVWDLMQPEGGCPFCG